MNDKLLKIEKRFFHQSSQVEVGHISCLPFPSLNVNQTLNANTFISLALSGRGNMNALVAKLPELEKYLDSDFSTLEVLPQTQQEYLVLKNEEIRELVQMMSKFKELLPLLDSDRFRNVLDKSEKLSVCFDFDIPDQPYLVNLSSKV